MTFLKFLWMMTIGFLGMRVSVISNHWEFGFLVVLVLGYLSGIYEVLRKKPV